MEITMQPVQSSAIAEVGYDPETYTLRIRFTPNKTNPAGAIYDYENVPEQAWDDFQSAPSVGSYWHSRIKNVYTARRVA